MKINYHISKGFTWAQQWGASCRLSGLCFVIVEYAINCRLFIRNLYAIGLSPWYLRANVVGRNVETRDNYVEN